MINKIFCEAIFVPEYELHETNHHLSACIDNVTAGIFTKRYLVFKNTNRISGYCNKNRKKAQQRCGARPGHLQKNNYAKRFGETE